MVGKLLITVINHRKFTHCLVINPKKITNDLFIITRKITQEFVKDHQFIIHDLVMNSRKNYS